MDSGESSGVPTTGGVAGSTGAAGGTSGSGGSGSGTGGSTTGEVEETCGFLCGSSGDPPGPMPCDMFKQDCPEGQKCAPYAEGGGSSWNATKCVPVTGNGQPGDVCTTDGGGGSGLDDCAEGMYCWDVDEMNKGLCVEMCSGTSDNPACSDPENFICGFAADVLALCFPNCDLLLQDCPGDELCIPIGETAVCEFDASAADRVAFDPCEFRGACDKGLLCVGSAAATECDPKVSGCCLPMCDLDLPDPMCPGAGQSCVPLFEPDAMVAMKHEHVGICMIPE